MWLTETEFHQKMRNIKFLIYFTFPQASLPSMSAQMRWVRGIGVTTVGRHGSQFFALIAPHPEIGGPKSEGAYACECLQQHDAAARRRGRGCATTRFRAQLMPYGRHCGSGLRRLRGTLITRPCRGVAGCKVIPTPAELIAANSVSCGAVPCPCRKLTP